jgi:ABC-type polysaccharide transport system permease subunit
LGEALIEGEGLTAFLNITQYWSVPLIFLWVFYVVLLDIILVCMVIVWWYKNYLLEHLGENSLKALGYHSTQATVIKLGKIWTSAGVASVVTFTAGELINEYFYSDNYRKYLESMAKLPTDRVPMVAPPKK